MKKLLAILVLNLLLISSSANAGSIGTGPLTLSPGMADYFIKYLKGGHGKAPMMLILAKDQSFSQYWYCPAGQGNCTPSNPEIWIKKCEMKATSECFIFARSRTVRWKNGINPGKGKESRFNSKWSDEEIKAKLRELGFLGTESESFVTKKEKTSTNLGNTVEQLETLTKLYESGALTEEEFKEAKKKILND